MKRQRRATIELTEKEADVLHLCVTNGYGDGDFNELLDRSGKSALSSAWRKLHNARLTIKQDPGPEYYRKTK